MHLADLLLSPHRCMIHLMVLSATSICVHSIPLPWISVDSVAQVSPLSYPCLSRPVLSLPSHPVLSYPIQVLDSSGHIPASCPELYTWHYCYFSCSLAFCILLSVWLSPTRTYPRYTPRGMTSCTVSVLTLQLLCLYLALSLLWPQCLWHCICVLFSFTGWGPRLRLIVCPLA